MRSGEIIAMKNEIEVVKHEELFFIRKTTKVCGVSWVGFMTHWGGGAESFYSRIGSSDSQIKKYCCFVTAELAETAYKEFIAYKKFTFGKFEVVKVLT